MGLGNFSFEHPLKPLHPKWRIDGLGVPRISEEWVSLSVKKSSGRETRANVHRSRPSELGDSYRIASPTPSIHNTPTRCALLQKPSRRPSSRRSVPCAETIPHYNKDEQQLTGRIGTLQLANYCTDLKSLIAPLDDGDRYVFRLNHSRVRSTSLASSRPCSIHRPFPSGRAPPRTTTTVATTTTATTPPTRIRAR